VKTGCCKNRALRKTLIQKLRGPRRERETGHEGSTVASLLRADVLACFTNPHVLVHKKKIGSPLLPASTGKNLHSLPIAPSINVINF